MQGQFVAIDHDFLYGILEFDAVAVQRLGQAIGDLVEVEAVRAGATARQHDLAHQSPVSGGVAAAFDAEHAATHVDHFFIGGAGLARCV